MTDALTDWKTDICNDRLIDCLIYWLADRTIDWLIGSLIDLLTDW